MITGTVNARHEVTVRLPVRDAAGQEQEVEVVLDTGFTGFLTLPPSLVASLGLPWTMRAQAVLANGAIEHFDIYTATVIWDGVPRPVRIQAVDTDPLLGMAFLVGYDLRARILVGGRAEIEAVP